MKQMTILNTFASSLSAHPPRSTNSTLIQYLKEFAKMASMTEINPNGRIASITQMFLLFLNFLIERFYASFSARHASSIVPKQRISYMRLNLHQSIRASVICYFSWTAILWDWQPWMTEITSEDVPRDICAKVALQINHLIFWSRNQSFTWSSMTDMNLWPFRFISTAIRELVLDWIGGLAACNRYESGLSLIRFNL